MQGPKLYSDVKFPVLHRVLHMSAFLWHLKVEHSPRCVLWIWNHVDISWPSHSQRLQNMAFSGVSFAQSFHQFHPLQLRYSSDWPRCLPRPVWFAVSVHGPEVEVVAVQEVSWGQWYHGIPPARRRLVEAQNRAPNLWLSWRWPKIKWSKKMLGKTLRLSEPWNKCIVICICKIVNCTYAWIFLLYELTCQSPINAICQRCETANATHVSCWQTSICLRADQTYPKKHQKTYQEKSWNIWKIDPTQNIPKPSKLDNFAVLSKSQQIASKECRWLFHLPLVLVVFEPLCSVDRSWSCRSNCKMMWNYPCRACISWCACHGPNRIADSWNISWCDFTPSMAIRSISMKAERKSMEKRIHPKRIKKIHKVNKE